jgi:hypothetical protein
VVSITFKTYKGNEKFNNTKLKLLIGKYCAIYKIKNIDLKAKKIGFSMKLYLLSLKGNNLKFEQKKEPESSTIINFCKHLEIPFASFSFTQHYCTNHSHKEKY